MFGPVVQDSIYTKDMTLTFDLNLKKMVCIIPGGGPSALVMIDPVV